MKNLYNKGHRDGNEKEIIEIIKCYHLEYSMGMPGDGYDILLQTSPMVLIEVKDPGQPPSKRRLSEDEESKKNYCIKMNIPYYVIETPEEMVKIIDHHHIRRKK